MEVGSQADGQVWVYSADQEDSQKASEAIKMCLSFVGAE